MKKSISFFIISSLLMSMQPMMAQEAVPEDLFKYIREGNVEGIRMLIYAGVDVNQRGAFGEIPLITAVEKGDGGVVRELLRAPGIDVNIKGWMGMTALMQAVLNKDIAMLKMLLQAGADWRIKNSWGTTAFDLAIESDFKDAIKVLVRAGVHEELARPGSDYKAYLKVPIVQEALTELLREGKHMGTFQELREREIGGWRKRR